MDGNIEEASRATILAENKMQNGDFLGALKLLMKAQQLYSGLERLQKLLAICHVHSSAEQKINGLENWYGILQVNYFADDATIKKQYRKLALLLHPDKNQFAGAEAAFKWIGEANRFLADQSKRSQYDVKYRLFSRVAGKQLNGNSGRKHAAANHANGVVYNAAFWTRCEHCGHRYKYLREYVNTSLHCSSCQRSYMAYDTGYHRMPPEPASGQFSGKKKVQNQGPCKTSLHNNVVPTGVSPGSAESEVGENGTVKEKTKENNGGVENKNAGVRKPRMNERFMENYAKPGKSEKGKGGMKTNAELPKADVINPQSKVTEPEMGASKSMPDVSVPRSGQAFPMSKGKAMWRKVVKYFLEGFKVERSVIVEDKVEISADNKRKFQRKEQPITSAVERSNDDFVSPPTKKSKLGVDLKSERPDSGCSSVSSCIDEGKAKENVDSGYQGISLTQEKESEANGEKVVTVGKMVKDKEKPITQDSPDTEFNDFELKTDCFAVNQVWSLYDPTDGMPRFYAQVKKVFDAEFKLWITWLEPIHVNTDKSIPVASGIFTDGDTVEVDDHLMFSCFMPHLSTNKNIVIYPRKGEIWGLFRGWNSSWKVSSENHKLPYEYDFVEVLSDFKDPDGLGVAYLGMVEGFVSLFFRKAQHGVLQMQIPPSEMLRFSHKVPSFKMTGDEKEGVPPGCFELDTAALPKDIFEVSNSIVNADLDQEKLIGKTDDHFPEASKVEVEATITLESSPSPQKRKRIHDNGGSFSTVFDGKCSNHDKAHAENVLLADDKDGISRNLDLPSSQVDETNSLKKSKKNVKLVDDLKLRRSSRLSSETNNQATSNRETAEKNSPKDGEFCEQPNGFSLSGEKMDTSKKPEKVIKTYCFTIRKSPRDIQKLKGNSTKNGRNDETKCSESETPVSSSYRTRQENTFNFNNQRSQRKFQISQVWAIYNKNNGMPTEYAQIKKIDTTPEFKLHVAPLQLHRPPKHMPRPVSCGCFKLKTGIADVLKRSSFSHQVKAVEAKKIRFEVYPVKGEIWALYKNSDTNTSADSEEYDVVEVVETDELSIQVLTLTAKGSKTLYVRSEESLADVIDISKTDVFRFSHQIPAFRHERNATGLGDVVCWELDPKAVPGLAIMLD